MRWVFPIFPFIVLCSCQQPPITEFRADFEETVSSNWSKQKVSSTALGERTFLGPFGFEEVTLKLDSLAQHNWVTIEFDLYLLGSWNGNNTKYGPDVFTVALGDGRVLHRTSFSQRLGKYSQAYPGFFPIHRLPERTGAVEKNTLGHTFKNEESSTVYRVKRTIPHRAKSVKIKIMAESDVSSQNESWGIDNFKLTCHDQIPALSPPSQEDIETQLGGDDGVAANAMVDHLVQGGEASVELLLGYLKNASRPLLADELLSPQTLFYEFPHSADTREALILNEEQRRQMLVAFALQMIGNPLAQSAVEHWKAEDDLRSIPVNFVNRSGKKLDSIPVILTNHFGRSWRAYSNEEGQVMLKVSEADSDYFRLTVDSEFYVYNQFRWQRRTGTSLPESITMQIDRPVAIGGKVVDEQGRPVAGATVYVHPKVSKDGKLERTVKYGNSVVSDEEGRWIFKRCHPKADEIELAAYHPQYVSNTRGFYQLKPHQDLKELYDKNAVLTLKRGKPLEVLVQNSKQEPIQDAQVFMGEGNVASNAHPWHSTDTEGKIRLAAEPGSFVVITVKAKGFSPELVQFQMPDSDRRESIILKKASALRGQVIDSKGVGIKGVTVFMDTWRGFRTLSTRLKTDSTGHFVWEDAPVDAVEADIFKRGFADRRGTRIQSDSDNVITLSPPTVFEGKVVDAKTSLPIDDFEVVRGISSSKGQPFHWQGRLYSTSRLGSGLFELELMYPHPWNQVRVSAPGYSPAESAPFQLNGNRVVHEFRLNPVDEVCITLENESGEPIANASVVVLGEGQNLTLTNFSISKRGSPASQLTSSSTLGEIKFTPPGKKFLVVITHETGIGIISSEAIQQNKRVNLHHFGKVKGTAYRGKSASSDTMIGLAWDWQSTFKLDEYYKTFRISFNTTSSTDTAGRFVFERVPVGTVSIGQYLNNGSDRTICVYNHGVEVEPQKTAQVRLGGTGITAIGSLELPELAETSSWIFGSSSLSRHREAHRPELPAEVQSFSQEKLKDWLQTKEGQLFKKRQMEQTKSSGRVLSFPVIHETSQRFKIYDVPPGKYSLSVSMHERLTGSRCGYGEQLATLIADVEIPKADTSKDEKPFDLGSFTFELQNRLKVGDSAPDFSLKALDGEEVRLSKLKGKFVLIDFWATWCGPCRDETPFLKAIHDRFGSRKNFEMIALSSDSSMDALKSYVSEHQLSWKQCLIDSPEISKAYGIRGIPSIWLVDPDGTVVAKNLRGDRIAKTLEKFLN
ncbi:MAG: redoxin domain-containing protein [Verrucomicrobiota bacterium]